ncbi:8-hydroxygeraniol oxidoreductase isoform X1 [Gossypium raimondii]|uniref:8-hydroxygeraniol oxidoreductase isoform X1 n=1 Tax=Gossypium raimondii TaxID=29730 RepID=UPI00227C8B75|nr:8-hydroxygeraniol oxidoreductase isoform X1 [Gossypium raimondii]
MTTTNSHVITCKGIVSWGKGEPLKVEEILVEPPKSNEVRVKMLYASVCRTDLLFANGFPIPAFPRVMGHEGVGVVESIGEGVTGLREGDLVIPTYIADCKTCETCMSEKTNLCLKYPLSYKELMQDGSSRMSIRGQTASHAFSCSTWCQYLVINVNFLLKIDPKTPLPDASFLSCGFSTGYGATWKEAMVQNGSSVAVFGLGAVGLGAIKGAKSHGAIKVIGIDNNPMKAAKGRAFGMTDFINPGESDKSIAELVKDLTAGMGVDYSFECTGVPPLINEAIQSTKLVLTNQYHTLCYGTGKIIQMGVEEPNVNINIIELLIGRTLKGSIFGGLKAKTDLPIIYSKCKNREIQLDELLSHEIKLEEVNKVFELLKQPDCVKILIKI